MSEPGLITEYVAALAGQLPSEMVTELADGLRETHRHYLGQGLGPDAAARAALAEFGEVRVVVAAFTRASPARRAARRLLVTGPLVGACWGTALITGRAWAWPIPGMARILFGAALFAVIGLLAAAAFGERYRPAGRAGAAGCAGIAALDLTLITAAVLAGPAVTGPVLLAMAASVARLTFATRAVRPALLG